MRSRKMKAGFTLIELMVVVIIVGVLAAASVPLYQGNVRRAIRAEAIATMGSIRSAQRVYRAEHGVYFTSADAAQRQGANLLNNIGIGADALVDVAYFGTNCYDLTDSDTATFTVRTTSRAAGTGANQNNASRAAQVLGFWPANTVVATMDEGGIVAEF